MQKYLKLQELPHSPHRCRPPILSTPVFRTGVTEEIIREISRWLFSWSRYTSRIRISSTILHRGGHLVANWLLHKTCYTISTRVGTLTNIIIVTLGLV